MCNTFFGLLPLPQRCSSVHPTSPPPLQGPQGPQKVPIFHTPISPSLNLPQPGTPGTPETPGTPGTRESSIHPHNYSSPTPGTLGTPDCFHPHTTITPLPEGS